MDENKEEEEKERETMFASIGPNSLS